MTAVQLYGLGAALVAIGLVLMLLVVSLRSDARRFRDAYSAGWRDAHRPLDYPLAGPAGAADDPPTDRPPKAAPADDTVLEPDSLDPREADDQAMADTVRLVLADRLELEEIAEQLDMASERILRAAERRGLEA